MHLTIPGHLRGALLALVLLLGACVGGSPAPAEPTPGSGSGSGSGPAADVGGEGTVCRAGERQIPGQAPPEVQACAAGLRCCYPCGIPGCDSVCMADCGPPRP